MDGGRHRAEELSRYVARRVRAAGTARCHTDLLVRYGISVCLVLFLPGCNAHPPATSPTAVDLRIGFAGANIVNGRFGIGQFTPFLTIESLTYPGVDGRPTPRLAESWQWEDDGLALRIRLRPGVKFHDGTPLTATIAAEILRKSLLPDYFAAYPSLADITAIRPTGELEFVIDLSRQSALLPEDLNLQFVLDAREIGTGPYRVAKRDRAEAVLEAFEPYYLGRPSISRVVVRPFDTLRTAWSGLLRGEVDMVSEVPPDSVEFVQTGDVDVVSFASGYQYLIAFNSQKAPFKSASVRRALNFAVDRNTLVQRVFRGYATVATGPLWPKHWAYDATVSSYGFEPAMAVSLLENAGFETTSVAGEEGPPARLRFTCLLASGFGVTEKLALEVQKQLYDVGIDMQFEVVTPVTLDARIRTSNFDAVLTDMISGPTFNRPYLFWRSAKETKGYNFFGYENADAEQLFQTLRSSRNEAAIRSATQRLQTVLSQDPPALFLAWSERIRTISRSFTVLREAGRDPMFTLWRWTPDKLAGSSRTSLDQ